MDEEGSHTNRLINRLIAVYTPFMAGETVPGVGILAGLRIVEISAFVAAPLAGATLSSLGADVVRLEQRGGGVDARRWPVLKGRSLYRDGLDRGKRSVALDLQSVRGQELAAEIITTPGAGAGIFVTNLEARGWMAYETLARRRSDLIMVTIGGTHSGRPAVDYTVNAALGFPLVTGPASLAGPVNHVLPAWDVTTGLLAAIAVLAAELRRRETGRGEHARLALADTAAVIAEQLGFLAEARQADAPRQRIGNDLYGAYGRDFATVDGRHVMVVALTRRQWRSLVAATGLESRIAALERSQGVDLDDEGSRFEQRSTITTLLEPWIASRTLEEVAAAFDSGGVLWSPYRTFQEAVRDDPRLAHPRASPLVFSTSGEQPAAAPPRSIGSDTEAILVEILGLGEGEIAALRSAEVID